MTSTIIDMRNKILIALVTVLSLSTLEMQAQYGYGYGYGYNPYMQQQQMQQAYEYGRMQAERDQQALRNNPDRVFASLVDKLGKGYVYGDEWYCKAYDDAEHLAVQLDDARGYLMLGRMEELGIGYGGNKKYAKKMYAAGAELNKVGSKECRQELRRIEAGNWYTSADAEAYKLYWSQIVTNSYAASNALSSQGSSSSSGSSYSSGRSKKSSGTCTACGGTGVNPTHISGSSGSMSSWNAYYNNSGTKCPYCGYYDGHMHDRCSSCNVPNK